MNTRRAHSAPKQKPETLTIVLMSDTHELHRELEVPDGDILIHAGDSTMFSKNAAAILDFNEWLGDLPHRSKILVPGNHEFFLEADLSRRGWIPNAIVLINESIEVMGLKIWGSPMTPLYGGAFGKSSEQERMKVYERIPNDIDILITHGPPYGILDQVPGSDYHSGCRQLLSAVHRVAPVLHVFGHVHSGYGTFDTADTLFVNAALPGKDYDLTYPPHVLRLPRR